MTTNRLLKPVRQKAALTPMGQRALTRATSAGRCPDWKSTTDRNLDPTANSKPSCEEMGRKTALCEILATPGSNNIFPIKSRKEGDSRVNWKLVTAYTLQPLTRSEFVQRVASCVQSLRKPQFYMGYSRPQSACDSQRLSLCLQKGVQAQVASMTSHSRQHDYFSLV